MSVFADSSALVKLYADEPGHERIRLLDLLVVSHLARVEVLAALWRKHRIGEISTTTTQVLVAEFEADFFGTAREEPRFLTVAVTPVVLDEAAKLVPVHGLRAYDAVQLASGLAARAAEPACDTFAAADADLRRAAGREGFELVP